MNQFFCTITEQNKLSLNKPVDADVVYYSELNEWFTSNAFRNFSLKYVVDKCIYYKIANKEFAVASGNLMLGCKQPFVKAYFDSAEKVKSICIDIRPATVAEVFTILSNKDDINFDNYLAGYFQHPVFCETVSPVGGTQFRDKLNQLVSCIMKGNAHLLVNREWFLDLVEKIVYHEYKNYTALSGIRSIKWSTRKELLQRLQVAKQFMDESFLDIGEIADVAVVANLSEFHFYRSFKEAFAMSPYQYLLDKRLVHAKQMIIENHESLSSIALLCNFPDLATFSKAFKRQFGIAPSTYLQQGV